MILCVLAEYWKSYASHKLNKPCCEVPVTRIGKSSIQVKWLNIFEIQEHGMKLDFPTFPNWGFLSILDLFCLVNKIHQVWTQVQDPETFKLKQSCHFVHNSLNTYRIYFILENLENRLLGLHPRHKFDYKMFSKTKVTSVLIWSTILVTIWNFWTNLLRFCVNSDFCVKIDLKTFLKWYGLQNLKKFYYVKGFI